MFQRRGFIRQGLERFLYGRNGPDTLYHICFWSAFVLAFFHLFWNVWPLALLYVALLGYALFRFFSKNVNKRRAENQAFVRFWRRIRQSISLAWKKLTDRKHAYRKCPQCGGQLRLPRVKGTHTTRCPRCGTSFSVKI